MTQDHFFPFAAICCPSLTQPVVISTPPKFESLPPPVARADLRPTLPLTDSQIVSFFFFFLPYQIEALTHPSTNKMSSMTEITSIPEWEQLLASVPPTALVVVSFHAPWAAPCAQMATVLSTLASEYPVTEPPTTKWVSINAEELSDLSETYDVTAVPFLVLLRNGQVVETVSGSSAVKVRTAIETQAKQSGQNAEASAPNGVDANDVAVEEQDPEKKKEELFKRLGDLVKAAPVMLFMKGTPSSPQCGFSRQLVGLLRDNSVKYGFFNILADDEVRQGLKEFADWPTYPQLWIDGELVGGLDIVS
jgi:Grx4 family monothiol glutaredoxin